VLLFLFIELVSNPWREAIEEPGWLKNQKRQESFQSLEGGY